MFGVAIPCLKHFQNNVSGTVFLRMRLLCRADNHLSNLDCAALRAMTGPKSESADMMFVVFMPLLKLCGATLNFDQPSPFALRRVDFSR